jgi:hypothetical protein
LDKHEDNRYAKVNFGGNLENTYAGSVVLEADKLFKTLGAGIDPNTHQLMISKITKEVPDFLTEDERNLIDDSSELRATIRYWFYPDSIGTVTDGSIGAVLTNQFVADVERMDVKVNVGNAVRKTIDHLNQNFNQYERAENTFKELSTVGRIMALINWLNGMNMDDRMELDELLSVKIPAFTTPKRTKKMLAVTAIAFPSNSYLNSRNVRDYTKVYYISDLLDQYSSSSTDDDFLYVAKNWFSQIDISDISPLVNKSNNIRITAGGIFSITGGINLRPSEFKRISRNTNAPKLRELRKVKGKIKTVGKVAKSGDWIRNISSGISGSRINKLSTNSWTSSKSVNGGV